MVMPSDNRTIGGPVAPKVNWWDELAWKWFGRGPWGSAIYRPSQWFSPPAQVAPNWTPTMPLTTVGEEPIQPWEIAGITEEQWKKQRPWRAQGMTEQEYTSYLQSQLQQKKQKAFESVAPTKQPDYSPWAPLLKQAYGVDIQGLEKASPEQMGFLELLLPQLASNRELQTKLSAQERQAELDRQTAQENRALDTVMAEWSRQEARKGKGENAFGKEQQERKVALDAQQMGIWADEAKFELEKRSYGFETMRNEIMSSAAPRDWVVREKTRLAINPYQERLASFVGYQGMGESGIPNQNPFMAQIPIGVNLKTGERVRYTGVPEVAGEVQPFMGKEKSFGAPIETPSGQAWFPAPWTTQEKLIGYGEALGTPESDLLGNIKRMLPRSPSQGISWTPASRR